MLSFTCMPFWNSLSPRSKIEMNASDTTFYNSTAKTSTVTLMVLKTKKKRFLFNEKTMGETLCSVWLWQILWPAKMEVVSHTVKEWKTGRNVNLDGPRAFAKRCHRVDVVFVFFFRRDSQSSFKSYYYTSDSLWKIWLVQSIQSIHNSLWTWHDKCNICCRYCIYHVKFNLCLVTKPLGVLSSETEWLNASLLFLRMNYKQLRIFLF